MGSDAYGRGSIAALGFAGFAASHLHQRWLILQETPAAEAAIGYATAVGGLLHELHRERGSSALFLGSRGAQFRSELQAARGGLDAAVLH
ncbi:nitrate- and nitrite sensing domain-containing protein, partial [Ferrovibrio sp.]